MNDIASINSQALTRLIEMARDSQIPVEAARTSTPYGVTYDSLKERVDATDSAVIQLGINVNSAPYNIPINGTTDAYAAMSTLLTAIGGTPTTLIIPYGTIKLSTSIVFPANVNLVFLKGGMLSPNATKTVTINGNVEAGFYQIFTGAGTIIGDMKVKELYPAWWGAKTVQETAGFDSTQAFIKALAFAKISNIRRFQLGAGQYKIISTLNVEIQGVVFVGQKEGVFTTVGGTEILYHGTGALFELGSDDGLSYDASNYDGMYGFNLENITLTHNDPLTALENTRGNYRSGTYGIRDWRGGHVYLRNVMIQRFEFGFWGIQSDINHFVNLQLRYNHCGMYLGARSDQNTMDHLYTLFNDRMLWIDKAAQTRINNLQSDSDGSATTIPIKISSQYAVGAMGTVFNDCWFENYTSALDEHEAFVEIGVGDAVTSSDIIFRNPKILTNPQSTIKHTKFFLKIGNATRVKIDHIHGETSNLAKTLLFVGAINSEVYVVLPEQARFSNQAGTFSLSNNTGAGTPKLYVSSWGFDSNKLYSPNGRLYVGRETANNQRDFYIGSESDGTFVVDFASSGTGNTRLISMDKRLVSRSAIPTTLAWLKGDIAFNSNPDQGSPVGWRCVASGTPGTWVSFGQNGNRTNSGTPQSVLTPIYIGEDVLDTTNKQWYKSVGTLTTDWKQTTV
jgi:hypothetical protein